MTSYAMVVALLATQLATGTQATPAPPGSTLTLDDALREGQARNLDIKASRARLEQAREAHWKAWSHYLPQATLGGSYTHNDLPDVSLTLPTGYAIRDVGAPLPDQATPGLPGAPTNFALAPTGFDTFVIQKQNQLAAQFQVTQALIAPQAWFGISAANAGEEAAADTIENTRRQILFSTAQAYYGAAGLKQVVSIQERQLAISREHERDARVRYEAGTTPKVSLLRAEIDRARAEQDLKRAQNSYASAKIAIATLLDRKAADFEVVVPPSPRLPASLDALEQDAVRVRPDLQAAEANLRLAERNHDGVVARYVPTLGAFAQWQWVNLAGFTGRYSAWAVGVAATWTILDGGLRESDLRESAAKIREADITRLSAQAKAVDEVKRARLDLDSAVANREKAKEQLSLAQENQKLVDVNYRAGAATYLEVSDANMALLSAELTQVSESLNADLAALRVLFAAGVFNPT